MVAETGEPMAETLDTANMSVDEQWENFLATVLSHVTNPIQIEETRRGFYAGFYAALTSTSHAARENQTEDEGVIQLEKWYAECEQFFREITVEHYGEQPPRH